jgi:eukaryotic-like serine/threonine-protein kinase
VAELPSTSGLQHTSPPEPPVLDAPAETSKKPHQGKTHVETLQPSVVIPRMGDSTPNYSVPASPPNDSKLLSNTSGFPVSPAVPADRPEIFPRMFGGYELIEEIARGGMGVVYKAVQVAAKREVALKMILEGRLTATTAVLRFQQEAHIAASLDHPNIVPIYDIGEWDGKHYFTMPLIKCGSLQSLVQKRGPLADAEAARLVAEVADGVALAHEHGLIHRDLKPDNVLIDSQNRPRITDFGLAKQMENNNGMTAANAILGTPAYMSPEQALGGKNRVIGPPTDVYALGGILYYLITGKPPFLGETVSEVLCQVVKDNPVPPREINHKGSVELENICLQCLEKEPDKRFFSAQALAEALRELLPSLEPKKDRVSSSGQKSAPSRQVPNIQPEGGKGSQKRRSPVVPVLWVLASVGLGLLIAIGIQQFTPVATESPGAGAEVAANLAIHVGGVSIPEKVHPGDQKIIPVSGNIPSKGAFLVKDLKSRRDDFKFTFAIEGANRAKDGTWTVIDGQSVQCTIFSECDVYVTIWDVKNNGSIVQLFPNEKQHNQLWVKNQTHQIPGRGVGHLLAHVAETPEHLVVVATTEEWDPKMGLKRKGPFPVFDAGAEAEAKIRDFETIEETPTARPDKGLFKLKPDSLKVLLAQDKVPQDVLAKLLPLQEKPLERDQFQAKLKTILNDSEWQLYQDRVMEISGPSRFFYADVIQYQIVPQK